MADTPSTMADTPRTSQEWELNVVISARTGSSTYRDIPEDEFEALMDKFIELLEAGGYQMGGGWRPAEYELGDPPGQFVR